MPLLPLAGRAYHALARTRFPASREWHSHSQEPCLTPEFDALRAGRGSEFKPARGIPKRNTTLTDGVFLWLPTGFVVCTPAHRKEGGV